MRSLRAVSSVLAILAIVSLTPEFLDSTESRACSTSEPPEPTVVVLHGTLTDNGDDDGWADTNETVEMRLSVLNRLGLDLTGLVATLSTDDPKIDCITDPILIIGDLAAGESQSTEEAFTFRVADVDRTSVEEHFSVEFAVAMSADQFDELPVPQWIVLDLDLDASGGSGPGTFFEGFESGFGAFTTMHLDQDLNPPDGDLDNDVAGVLNSDGYRCQYSNPDWRESQSYGHSQGEACYLNPNGASDAFWFHTTEDRAFSGAASMYFGIYLEDVQQYTTPTAQLEAIRTIDPINLGWDRVCDTDRLTPCESDVDCPTGQACVDTSPVLAFTHQASFFDHRFV